MSANFATAPGSRVKAGPPLARFAFENAPAPIAVPDTPDFRRALQAAAPGWPVAPDTSDRAVLASVVPAGDAYELRMDGEEPIRASAVSAACGIMVDVLEACLDAEPERLCLHCGSVEFAGRIVVFPSRSKAGKSTLVGRLAAAGHRVFGDDVLPLSMDDMHGLGTGLAPRLRLPLPDCATPAFRSFVDERNAAQDGRYLYLSVPQGRLAARHETAPLGAVVLLDRRESGPAFLSAVRRSLVLRELILQNFSQESLASSLLDRIHRLMDPLPAFALHYSDLDEAAALLETTFAHWPPRAEPIGADDPRAAISVSNEPSAGITEELRLAGLFDGRFRRVPGTALRHVDGETFLARPEAGLVHQLNPLGGAIWALLDQPTTPSETVALLREAFPDVDPAQIRSDVETLFGALLEARFIEADES